ncbi:sigma-70 family RNA polymerase sigma factor [Achromobacter aloeverae]|uniref:RNA polymerase subunit sigma-70 n=1 Tax=Achromobacter aloeverae TaxID=1750518 RepID=A0A4Q1HHS4_9BURK|nr:sigma-70 family RNA polymerase sigma factor [Achromobacter aloeverae]RXN87056.1 RNA polymerase subunit sigma-70 [Achromobacter aloeverae]
MNQTALRRHAFEKRLADLRPALHRFCARMVGSVIDGEDVVQETLVKALTAYADQEFESVERWVFHIAHNAAIDFIRRRSRMDKFSSDEDPDMTIDDQADATRRIVARAGLRQFMRLPVAQRGCTALVDVLGHSLKEAEAITGMTIPAIKAALHRGRARLRELADEPPTREDVHLSQADLARLSLYVEHFNARDFDAVRDMLADDVRLEVVTRTHLKGKPSVSTYFGNYSQVFDWRLVPGLVDGRAALLVFDPQQPAATPSYFVLLEFDGSRICSIRDFRHARYAVADAEVIAHGTPDGSS